MTEHAMELPDLGDAYRILRVLGSGGMGMVYLAHDERHDRQVAIKTIRSDFVSPEVIERFQREIKLMARLQHPRILPLLDSGIADGALYYVMQLVEGESLEERLKRETQLPVDEALRITRQVADALAYAHEAGIVHRDIKPGNIMLSGGHALVMDFGIARLFTPDADALTSQGVPIGTPAYMSPEQVSDATVVDGRSDIYSLGCVLYEMLAGQPPFIGLTVDSILRQQLAAQPTQIDVHRSTVPPHVKTVLQKALAKAPVDRFETAARMASALADVEAGQAPRVPSEGLLGELRRRRLVQFVTAYAAGGWVVLEATDQLAGNEILPSFLYPVALALLLCGLPGAFIVSWFHGARGDQPAPAIERWLLGGVAVLALMVSGITLRRELAANAPDVAPLEALAPTEDPRRIAVMYFESDEDSEFLASGLTESLIDELSAVEALHVVSRNGSALFRGERVTTDSIGRALAVGTLVDGTVATRGDQVEVRVELIRASANQSVASTRLTMPRERLFDLQDSLAVEVAFFLREQVGEEIEILEQRAGTGNVEAWELLQRAHSVREEVAQLAELGDLNAAADLYETADSLLAEAEGLDPGWIEPISERGWLAYEQARLGGFDLSHNAQWLPRAEGHAARALALAPDDPNARELRGDVTYWRALINLTEEMGDQEALVSRARVDLEAATTGDEPASAYSKLAHLYMRQNVPAQAVIAARRSYQADPYQRNASATLWRLVQASLETQQPVAARNACDEGQRRFPEDFRFKECQVWLYTLPGQSPDVDRAWSLCEEWVDLTSPASREFFERRCHMLVGMALVRANRPDSARAVFGRARTSADVDPFRELTYFEAIGRTWLGDFDEALDLLATYMAANPGLELSDDLSWWLEDLRADPRYQQLVGAG